MTTVYRCFDAEDRLLYVGMTDHLDARMAVHRSKSWWSQVARTETEEFSKRAVAREMERLACQVEGPLHNVLLVPGRTRPKVRAHRPSWTGEKCPSCARGNCVAQKYPERAA
jgi:predicted GIY-YIG superfamily endonuclease